MMNFNRSIILASNSPRRKQLLANAGFDFIVRVKEVEEDFPEDLPVNEVARYLAEKKAEALRDEIQDEVVIAADTAVILKGRFLAKPENFEEAEEMLKALSGNMHQVITGVCILDKLKKISFDVTTEVYFNELTRDEIHHYINEYQPYDKAGAYGIQEWIGLIGIKKINGSYYNVVGLPVQQLYEELKSFY